MNKQQAIDRLLKHMEWGWTEETAKQLKLDGVCNNENCVDCQYYGICDAGEKREELALDKAIEIVERGGRDETI